MDEPIKVGKGILEWVKETQYITGPITKKDVFDFWMQEFKDFYERYPYAAKWDYEKFIRELLDYYD
jgi:hypothetical protein